MTPHRLTHRIISLITLFVTIVSISSCSDSDRQYRLLQSVPADAVSVFTIRLDNIIEKVGIDLSGDTVTLPQALATLPEFNSALADASLVYKGIVNRRLVVFTLPQDPSNYIVTFLFDDISSLSPLIGYREKETRNGFDIYGSLAIRKDQCWLFSGKTRTTRLAEAIERASKKSILDTQLGDTLTVDHDINALLSTGDFAQIPGIPDLRLTAAVEIADKTMTCTVRAYTPQGTQLSLKDNGYISHISTRFLSSVSPQATAVAAIGIDKAFNISGITPWLLISGLSTSYVTLISEIIDAIDGTVAISLTERDQPRHTPVRPAASLIDHEETIFSTTAAAHFDITLSAQIKEQNARPLLNQARKILSDKGLTIAGKDPDSFSILLDDAEILVNLSDGMLTVSTTPPTEYTNSFAPIFTDRYFAFLFRIPHFGKIYGTPALDMGYTFDIQLDDNTITATLRVTDYPGTLVNSIFDIISTPAPHDIEPDSVATDIDLDIIDQLTADRHFSAE